MLYSHMAIQYHDALDHTFHALGDGTRRRILSMLAAEGVCTAGELGAPIRVAQPTVSKHLKVLERAGLVSREVEGRTHRFRLELAQLNEAQDWISRHKDFWEGSLAGLERYLDEPDVPESEGR